MTKQNLCNFLSSQKVTKKDLTAKTHSAWRLHSNSLQPNKEFINRRFATSKIGYYFFSKEPKAKTSHSASAVRQLADSSAAARRNAFCQTKIFLVPFCIDWQKGI
jgi:hypothetical protein